MFYSKSLYLASYIGIAITIFVVGIIIFFTVMVPSDLYCKRVMRVGHLDNVIYATTIDKELNYQFYKSENEGNHWVTTKNIPEELSDKLDLLSYQEVQIVCNPSRQEICYRITLLDGNRESAVGPISKLEESDNGGEHWSEVVAASPEQSRQGCGYSSPYSMAFVKRADQTYYLIVAMGVKGVLIQKSDGSWIQKGVKELTVKNS